MLDLKTTEEAICFKIFVQPRSSKNEIKGLHGDSLKVRLTAPPVDGAANKMCLKFLAKFFGVPKTAIEIVSGQSSRTKRVQIRPAAGPKRKADLDRIMGMIKKMSP